jgi:transglutaminase superfamily protein
MRFLRKLAAGARLLFRDPSSLLLTLRAFAWALTLTIAGPLVRVPSMLRMTETKRRWPERRHRSPEEVARCVDRVFHAGVFRDGTCWKRSAVLRRYLQMQDIETDVIYGVRKKDDGSLAAHAWLERNGAPILEREPPDYTVTFRHPPRT